MSLSKKIWDTMGFFVIGMGIFVFLFFIVALFAALTIGCSDNCTHLETDCHNNRIQLCDADGDWETIRNCKTTDQECIIDTEGDPICVD